ncbi:hypothetical protein D1871_10500 [Nakamurella silvestris]|nr:hypothetical protein D1871_10500 [Nakamurella silvestris]
MNPRSLRPTTRRLVAATALAALAFGAVTLPAQAAPSVQSPQFAAAAVVAAPAKADIRSNDYPENAWGAPASYPGVLVLSLPANSGAAGFAYSWGEIPAPSTDNSLSHLPPNFVKATNGEARITQPTNLGSGPKRLTVKLFDRNLGYVGATAYYEYFVPADVPGAGPSRREAENVAVTVTAGRTASGKTYGKGSISFKEADKASSTGARRYLLATGGNATHGPEFAFPFTAEVTGAYALGASLAKAKNFGKLRFFVVDAKGKRTALVDVNTAQAITFDGYAAKAQRAYQPLGGLTLAKGKYRLVVKVVGRNSASVSRTVKKVADRGYAGAVDFLTIVPLYKT